MVWNKFMIIVIIIIHVGYSIFQNLAVSNEIHDEWKLKC